jgi:ABC transporter fused permease/ATP-binding protein
MNDDLRAAPTPKPARRESFLHALRIFRYLLPYRRRVGGAMAAQLLATALGLSFPFLTGALLDAALGEGAPGLLGDINAIAWMLLATLAVQAGFSFVATYSFSRCGESALVDLRREVFGRLVRLPMCFFNRRRAGELASRLTSDMAVLQDTLTGSLPQFLRQTTLMVGGIALVAWTSWKLTALMLCTFPVLVLVAIGVGRRIRRHSHEAQDHLAEAANVMEESLQGIAGVKAFGAEALESTRYGARLENFLRVIFRVSRLRAILISFIIFGVFGSVVGVFWYGAHLLESGALTFGQLTRFILYTTFVGGSVASFADLFGQLQRTMGATERVRELLLEPVEDSGARDSTPQPLACRGEVEFQNVHFAYPSRRDQPVLTGLNLIAAPGESVALVGPSGAGKSTVLALLLRLYEPGSGRVLIDGKPASEIPLPALRSAMAIVPQDVMLFGGSIGDNIRYGRTDAPWEDVLAAARGAQCHEFVSRMPEGYETLVGDRGIQLSGGQRQRVAIARALLKNPAILLLDEATSSLDAESEHLVQQALGTLLEGRTAFIIAHRLSTIRKVHKIHVLDGGQIVESGTHNQLITQPNGLYRRFAEMQLHGETRPPDETCAGQGA